MRKTGLTLLLTIIVGSLTLLSCASPEDAIKRGDDFLAAGQYEEAIEEYSKAIKINRAHSTAYSKRGFAHYRMSNYDKSIADYDKVVSLAPDSARAYLYRGAVHGINGDYDKASTDHQTALKTDLLSPEDAAIQHGQWQGSFTMWTIYLRNGDYDKAIADYDTFTRLSPYEADTYMWRGCAYYLKGDDERAVADYDKALILDPDNALSYFKRGLSHARIGNPSQAMQDFGDALNRGFEEVSVESSAENPSEATTQPPSDHRKGVFHHSRGHDRLKQSDYDNAVADMDKARKLIDPQIIPLYTSTMQEVYFQSGIAYYDTGLYDQAIILFDKAVAVEPSSSDYPATYYHRGLSHFRKSSYRRAIADFDMIIHLEQDYPDATHYRELAHERLSK